MHWCRKNEDDDDNDDDEHFINIVFFGVFFRYLKAIVIDTLQMV